MVTDICGHFDQNSMITRICGHFDRDRRCERSRNFGHNTANAITIHQHNVVISQAVVVGTACDRKCAYLMRLSKRLRPPGVLT